MKSIIPIIASLFLLPIAHAAVYTATAFSTPDCSTPAKSKREVLVSKIVRSSKCVTLPWGAKSLSWRLEDKESDCFPLLYSSPRCKDDFAYSPHLDAGSCQNFTNQTFYAFSIDCNSDWFERELAHMVSQPGNP